MAYSREQLVLLALDEHGIPGAGQTPSAEDKKFVDDRLDSVMADLAQRNIYTWGDVDAIDDAAAIHLAKILAVASPIGNPIPESERLLAESRLRALNQVILSGQPQTIEWF
jgi:hypothetical protein